METPKLILVVAISTLVLFIVAVMMFIKFLIAIMFILLTVYGIICIILYLLGNKRLRKFNYMTYLERWYMDEWKD